MLPDDRGSLRAFPRWRTRRASFGGGRASAGNGRYLEVVRRRDLPPAPRDRRPCPYRPRWQARPRESHAVFPCPDWDDPDSLRAAMATETPTPDPPFRWDRRRLEAASLLAEDELTDQEIAARIGRNRQQLVRWKRHPEFTAKVKELAAELGALAQRYAIGRKARRVKSLQERKGALEKRLLQIQRVMQERADHPDVAGRPGAGTGLVVRVLKMIGSGAAAQVVEEYPVDTALLRAELDAMKALCEHEKQAAMELGQWVEKVSPTSPDGEEPYEPRGYEPDEVLGILRGLAARLGGAPAGAAGQQPPGAPGQPAP